MTWHLLTGEYPPDCGGVGDYSAQLAAALAWAGDEVHVWTPYVSTAACPANVHVHTLPDWFKRGSRRVLEEAWASRPGPILLQYVPNALGVRGANLAFCRWLRCGAHRGLDVRVMFHEPYLPFTAARPWRIAPAVVQRLMARELLRAAGRVFVSSAAWIRALQPYGPVSNATVLPIPSTIPAAPGGDSVIAFRRAFAGRAPTLSGHFGTYGDHIAAELRAMLPLLMARCPSTQLVLIGERSREFLSDLERDGHDISRIRATGHLSAADAAVAISACDLMLQPYPDGVTTRRTSVMAPLCNGVAVVTTDGFLTEQIWHDTRGVLLVSSGNPQAFAAEAGRLLDDPAARHALAERGRSLYGTAFAMDRTIAALRGALSPVAV